MQDRDRDVLTWQWNPWLTMVFFQLDLSIELLKYSSQSAVRITNSEMQTLRLFSSSFSIFFKLCFFSDKNMFDSITSCWCTFNVIFNLLKDLLKWRKKKSRMSPEWKSFSQNGYRKGVKHYVMHIVHNACIINAKWGISSIIIQSYLSYQVQFSIPLYHHQKKIYITIIIIIQK